MASISTSSTGQRRLLVSIDGRRLTRRLGTMSAKDARALEELVGDLESARLLGRPHDPMIVGRISRLAPSMRHQLASLGLVQPLELGLTVSQLAARYLASASFKPSTRLFYGHTLRNLDAFFPPMKLAASVTEADATAFVRSLVGLSPATLARRTIAARTIWRWGMKNGYVTGNPFKSIKTGAQNNPARKHYVPASVIKKLMDNASAEMRGLIALSRFAGLRCPSEAMALKWSDVDWDAGTIRITSSKTEHHAGKGSRIIPIFDELHPHLALLDTREPGNVIEGMRNIKSIWKQLKDLCNRAGVKPWPKLWHNMRASCQSDLSREFAPYVVCAWLGNSLRVAESHYLQVTPIDMERAQKRTRNIVEIKGMEGMNIMETSGKAGSVTIAGGGKWAVQAHGRRKLRADLKRTSKRSEPEARSNLRAHQLRMQLDLAHAYHRVVTRNV